MGGYSMRIHVTWIQQMALFIVSQDARHVRLLRTLQESTVDIHVRSGESKEKGYVITSRCLSLIYFVFFRQVHKSGDKRTESCAQQCVSIALLTELEYPEAPQRGP